MTWKEQIEIAMSDISIHQRVDTLLELFKSYSNEGDEVIGKIKAVIHTHLDAVAQGKGCEEYREVETS